jgi:hypothetical protein
MSHFTKADVAADWVARTNGPDLEPVQWDEPAASAPRPIERPSQHRRAWLTDFASRKGRTLRTIDDLWDVALAAGMLRPQPPDRFAPAVPTDSLFADGAVPPPVLDELRAEWRNQLPYTSEFHSGDIQHLIRWAPDGVLETTLARIAARYAVGVDAVLNTLTRPPHQGCWTIDINTETMAADTPMRVR